MIDVRIPRPLAVAFAGALLYCGSAGPAAGVTDAQRCEAALELAGGKYAQCRLKAESRFTKTGDVSARSAAVTSCDGKLDRAYGKMPNSFRRHPRDMFREHIYVAPFYEDDPDELVKEIPVERILFGSDYPHAEGTKNPLDYLGEFAHFPADIVVALRTPDAQRSDEQRARLTSYYLSIAPSLQPQRDRLAQVQKQLAELKPFTTVPVMRELPQDKRRTTRLQ